MHDLSTIYRDDIETAPLLAEPILVMLDADVAAATAAERGRITGGHQPRTAPLPTRGQRRQP
jgi:hypothetical protein